MKKLTELIKEIKFDYINSEISDDLFEIPKEIGTEFELVHFDKNISSEDAVKELSKDDWRPATAYELLIWAKENWNGIDWVVALGSVAGVRFGRGVLDLRRDGSERSLRLDRWGVGWFAGYRFLRVRNSVLKTLDTLSLTDLSILKSAQDVISKILKQNE